MRRGLVAAAGMLACALCAAQDAPRSLRAHAADFWDELKVVVGAGEVKRLRVEYENDVFLATDRNYTNGVRLTWRAGAHQAVRFDDANQYPWIPPLRFTAGSDAARRAAEDAQCEHAAQTDEERSAGRPVCYRTVYNFVFFGHNLYTPSDIRASAAQIGAGERPYAAWAYIGFHRELHASDGRYWRYGLDLGCIGPCAHGRQLQTWIHEHVTGSPLPNGWGRQIRNEFGAVVRFEYARRVWREALAPLGRGLFGLPLSADARPHVNFGIGNLQAYAGAGVTARLGWFRTSYDSLRLDTHALESLADARLRRFAQAAGDSASDCATGCAAGSGGPSRPSRPPELFGFARLHGDLVAYNALLQGGLVNRSSPHVGAARPLQIEREFGIAGALGEFSVSVSLVGRRQWAVDGERHGQRFGRVAVEFSTRF
ncbi:MAG: lipid A deacylase LpxR family protein [Burkholderiales bacterium]|nr:lipid A deacylase LpxR family protein [Burkholderiales bacterium]